MSAKAPRRFIFLGRPRERLNGRTRKPVRIRDCALCGESNNGRISITGYGLFRTQFGFKPSCRQKSQHHVLWRVKGNSMIDAGVDDEDLLVIDKSLPYWYGALAVCFVDGKFTLKKIKQEQDRVILMPVNRDYPPIVISKETEFMVWGIVTYVLKENIQDNKIYC